jgi:protein-disulfide isomerase
MLREFTPTIGLAYRHFPLVHMHPHAERAAEAAEAAATQGRFWEMCSLLFMHQNRLEPEDLVVLAEHLELDLNQFMTDTENHVHRDTVRGQLHSGLRSGVDGTPTLFVDGMKYMGDTDYRTIRGAIREAIAAHSLGTTRAA